MVVNTRKEKEKEQRREAILEAASQVFQRKGYQSTTMDEVAAEAQFSKGTLYLYFDSKFELFAELSNQVLGRVEQGFQNISETGVPGLQMVEEMLQLWAQTASSNIRQFRVAIGWIASDDTERDTDCPGVLAHRDRLAMVVGYLSGAIARGQADGSVARKEHAATMACQLWAGMMGALLFSSRCADFGDELPFALESESFMDDFVDLLSAGIGGQRS